MEKIIICYKFENLPSKKRNTFNRKLFGSKEKTHGGKYTTITKGFLSDKKYKKPVRSVIITSRKNLKGITQILNQFKAKKWIFKIKEQIT